MEVHDSVQETGIKTVPKKKICKKAKWLSEPWRSFLCSSSVCFCYLFLVFSASVRSMSFLSFWDHLFLKCSLGICSFLEGISSFSHSIIFLSFFVLITEEGFLVSPCYSLELCIQMGISFLFSFVFQCLSCMKKYYRLCGLGEGNGNPLQCSCLENPVDRGT